MKNKDQEEFDEWYETKPNKVFNFKAEMYNYCKADVDVLREGCVEFRHKLLEISKIDPFQYITLASVCSEASFYPRRRLQYTTKCLHIIIQQKR